MSEVNPVERSHATSRRGEIHGFGAAYRGEGWPDLLKCGRASKVKKEAGQISNLRRPRGVLDPAIWADLS